MRRFARRLAGLILAATLASGLTVRAGRDGRAARRRDRLRPARQGRGHARGARQAAGHRGPRGGQAGLRPRDDRAPRPARGDREAPRSRRRPAKPGETKWTVEKWGPVGAFLGWTVRPEFWDDQPFILVDYLPLRRLIAGRHDRGAAQGDRRQADHARRPRRTACDRWPTIPSGPRRRCTRSSAARSCRPRIARRSPSWPQADRGAQVAHAPRARGGEDHRPRRRADPAVHELGRAAERARSGRFDDEPAVRPSGPPRSSAAASRSAQRLMTYQAYSGDRLSDRRR